MPYYGMPVGTSYEEVAFAFNKAIISDLGGEARPELVVQLMEQGRITEERIDISVRRLLREKSTLGLFDNPYVDPDDAESTAGKEEFAAAGADAQRRAYTYTAALTCPSIPPIRYSDSATACDTDRRTDH